MAVSSRKRLRNILFQVPQVMKNRIELRIFNMGFTSQSDYLKYLIRKDLDEEERQLERQQQLVADIQHMAQDVDLPKIPSLSDQLSDI